MSITRRSLLAGLPAMAGVVNAAQTDTPRGLSSDFDSTRVLWLGFAPGHETLTRGIVEGLRDSVTIRLLVTDADADEAARKLWPALDVILEPRSHFFLRDVAVFTREGAIVDFRDSQDGASAWCLRRHSRGPERQACMDHAQQAATQNDGLDRVLAERLKRPLHPSPLAIEGGGVECNGRGLLIANEPLWRSRNPTLTRAEIERELRRLPGIVKVIWLPAGLAEDVHLRGTIVGPYVGWGTGGHTDEFVRFADARTVLLAWPDASDAHPVSRLNRDRMARNHALLVNATDAHGRRLRVIKVPMPRIVQRRVVLEDEADPLRSEAWRVDYFPAAERRRAGDVLWQVATASYLNFAIANAGVVLPDYLPHGTPPALQERVRRLFEQVFPGRRIGFTDAISANWVGGGPHCATLNQP
jgi:agmatine deiminase